MKHSALALSLLTALSLSACVGTVEDNGEQVSSSAASAVSNDMINVTNPKPYMRVVSPLTVTGEARGTWYFEASFPVRIVDSNGTEVAVAPAQAQGEWMTEDFVPFMATLVFDQPATATGMIVLEKDNPSGLPENADFIAFPVQF